MDKIGKVIILYFVIFPVGGCTPNLNTTKEEVDSALKHTQLKSYITDVMYQNDKKNKSNKYSIEITVKVDNKFSSLKITQQFRLLSDTVDYLDKELSSPECGIVNCSFGKFQIIDDNKKFGMEFNGLEGYDNHTLEVNKNKYTWYQLGSKLPIATQEEKAESSDVSLTYVSRKEVYTYMKE